MAVTALLGLLLLSLPRARAAALASSSQRVLEHSEEDRLQQSASPSVWRPTGVPLVINVWPFVRATERAWRVLQSGGSPVDAVVEGCSVCEAEQCDFSVGFGGSPDEAGETTLDAAVMDGDRLDVGAVGGLRRIKHAIRTARLVLERTTHSLLVGDHATAFALEMGVPGPEDLSTDMSRSMWAQWHDGHCQPNFRIRVVPNGSASCGPYSPQPKDLHGASGGHGGVAGAMLSLSPRRGRGALDVVSREGEGRRAPQVEGIQANGGRPPLRSHDTITMVAISQNGSIAAGSSTNGLTFHVPGRVGDAPIAGAGVYADSEVGGCGATGDGDVMMRFLPCFHAVELMRAGMDPTQAAQQAIHRVARKFPTFQGALFAVNRSGAHGGAVNNWVLEYTVWSVGMEAPRIFKVEPT